MEEMKNDRRVRYCSMEYSVGVSENLGRWQTRSRGQGVLHFHSQLPGHKPCVHALCEPVSLRHVLYGSRAGSTVRGPDFLLELSGGPE